MKVFPQSRVLAPVAAASFFFAVSFALAQTDNGGQAPPSTDTAPLAATPPISASAETNDRSAVVLSAIAKLDPLIGDVQVLGPWTSGDRVGVWRTVMTQPPASGSGNRFFFQQVEQTDGYSRVAVSTEVTEIAEVGGAVVGYRADPPAVGQESDLTIFFDIVPLDGEVSVSYELFVAPDAPYRFGPASN